MLNHYVEPENRISDKGKLELKRTLIESVQRELDKSAPGSAAEYQAAVRKLITKFYSKVQDQYQLTKYEQTQIFAEVQNDITGFGPIQPLLADPDISEIMVCGPEQVYIEKNGKLEDTQIRFTDSDHIMRIITRILSPLGRRVDQETLMVDATGPG